jgi:hypothetical protein
LISAGFRFGPQQDKASNAVLVALADDELVNDNDDDEAQSAPDKQRPGKHWREIRAP